MRLEDRIHMSLAKRIGQVVLRSDFADFGSSSQVSEALNRLMRDGKLIRISPGIYAKSTRDDEGNAELTGEPQAVVQEAYRRLGVDVRHITPESGMNHTDYWVDTGAHRVSRKLRLGSSGVAYPLSHRIAEMPEDVDLLPIQDVSRYVLNFARFHHVVYRRSGLDDWAESVTRASGDDVRLDDTGKLLVALKKENLINGRQLARLMTNHMREKKRARSIRGFPDSRLPAQH